ncbi:hypothetical protein [Streptomyces turgidiscabies]|uniref:hypothetical protein n=1 Tax=Streptomyces turgidiscabies TaxID=85558 RepID=UPI0038F81E7D
MDRRKQLHALIDAAIDAVSCEKCQRILADHITAYAVRMVGEHTAQELAQEMTEGKRTPAETYDALAEVMGPIYEAAGEAIPEELNERIRSAFLSVANRGLN